MPGVDGAQLLTKVMHRHPHTLRILLLDKTDRDTSPSAFGTGLINTSSSRLTARSCRQLSPARLRCVRCSRTNRLSA
jgi:hypothetical protein